MKNIPPVTRNLLFINVIIFMVQQLLAQNASTELDGDILTHVFGLHYYMASAFRPWQLVTYMFLHGSWSHVLFNMFSLWMFGRIIEQTMSQKRFLIYYFACGIGAGICQELWQTAEFMWLGGTMDEWYNPIVRSVLNSWVTIGASGACYGILLAFGMTFPNERIVLLFPPIPMKAKYFVIGYALIEVWSAFATNSNVAHFAHLGGMLFGFLLIRHWRKAQRRPQFTTWGAYAEQQADGSYGRRRGGTMQRIAAAFQRLGATLENGVRSILSLFKGSGDRKADGYTRSYDNPDHAYNARHKAEQQAEQKHDKAHQERIDRILDKVRRSGYDSLTEDEKQELFQK